MLAFSASLAATTYCAPTTCTTSAPHFIIGRTIGVVFNPVVGGPDSVTNLESSVKTKYDGLLLSIEKRFSHHYQFRAAYTLAKAFNFANDDQIPFSNGPQNPNNLRLEYGPTPNDQRHRFTFRRHFGFTGRHSSRSDFARSLQECQWIFSCPAAVSAFPSCNATPAARLFHNGAELNAFLKQINAAGGFGGQPLPLVSNDARFSDNFSSLDLRLSKLFKIGERLRD